MKGSRWKVWSTEEAILVVLVRADELGGGGGGRIEGEFRVFQEVKVAIILIH